jgi:hypothetical protein
LRMAAPIDGKTRDQAQSSTEAFTFVGDVDTRAEWCEMKRLDLFSKAFREWRPT